MKSGRRYVRKDFVAVALAVCFMCCGCGNGQEEALADTVIGGDAETAAQLQQKGQKGRRRRAGSPLRSKGSM